jgi:hypothetical protein
MTKPEIEIEHDGPHLFVVCDGKRIAIRGHEGTWIPLEPGYAAFGDEDLKTIIIEHNGIRIH